MRWAFSAAGLGLSAVYFVLSMSLVLWAVLAKDMDNEGKFLLLSLPLVPYEMVLAKLRLLNSMPAMPWYVAYATILPVILLALYLFGWTLERLLGTVIDALFKRPPQSN
jgi:hypothetical protein